MFYARAASLLAADATHQVTFLVEEYHTDSQRAALPTNVEQIRFPMDEDITEFLTKFNQKAFQPSTNFWGE
uniref:Uncharacterized protein n=1 Tax=Romanomermis culicivorax TaxID=13658 RepID=A0A915JD71_ROMCU